MYVCCMQEEKLILYAFPLLLDFLAFLSTEWAIYYSYFSTHGFAFRSFPVTVPTSPSSTGDLIGTQNLPCLFLSFEPSVRGIGKLRYVRRWVDKGRGFGPHFN